MLLLTNVHVFALALYFAVNVLLPAVSPVTRYVAVICAEAFAVALIKLSD